MKFSQDIINSLYRITAHEPSRIRVNDLWLKQAFIVTPRQLIEDWDAPNAANLSEHACSTLIRTNPEVLILGTGQKQQFPSIDIMKTFAQHQIGLEVMDSAAACRTFNILLSEDRHVVAGIMFDE